VRPLTKERLTSSQAAAFHWPATWRCTQDKKGFTKSARGQETGLEWDRTCPGVETICLDVRPEATCHHVCEGAVKSTKPGRRHGWLGFHRKNFAWMPPQQFDQHAHGRGRLQGRHAPFFLFQFRLRLQHVAFKKIEVRVFLRNPTPIPRWRSGYGLGKLVSEMF